MRPARPLVLVLILLTLVSTAPVHAAAPPNVLVLLSDDQRPDTIHALGNGHIRTPHLDSLVARGTAFTNAHIMGGLVGAVCMPSRSMILTGRTLFRAPPTPPADLPLWPEQFRKAGYVTFGTGKWHNGKPAYARCFSTGDDVFFGGMHDQTKVPVHHFDPNGKYPNANQRVGEKYSTELFADAAVHFLDRYGKEQPAKPFLMWIAFTVPHDPRMIPPNAPVRYDPATVPLPKNFLPAHPFDNGELKIRDELLLPKPLQEEAVRKDLADYYTLISHMDAQIGRILAALDAAGQTNNTIVVFAGDNGLAVGSHGLLGKQNLYQHSVGVPLIVAGPGVKSGARSDALVYLLDLYPTVAELTNQPLPPTVEGRSFASLLRGESKRHRDSLFFAYRDVQRAARDDRYKLIRYHVNGVTTEQLFDLHQDPDELHDLSKSPTHADTLDRLRNLLTHHQRALGDPKTPAA